MLSRGEVDQICIKLVWLGIEQACWDFTIPKIFTPPPPLAPHLKSNTLIYIRTYHGIINKIPEADEPISKTN